MKKRIVRIALLAIIALGISLALVISKNQNPTPKTEKNVAGISIGGAYDLVDHTGAPRTNADFQGDYKLIYFGFTYCPAICPTELQKITATLKTLPSDLAEKIQPLFITIDPERDTVDVMRDYITLFHEKFIGLTGNVDQIDAIKKNYRIYAQKVQDDTMTEYTMDHSSYIYLMSPDDELISIYRTKDTAADMAADIANHIK
ncbi:MAG: hypothetical protein CL570_07675 [Alphaproteobacteria bacterium]|nr:hypothetical protein [Alphaproteobacteria bacterium]HCQ70603.1 SCO family protein [Rhodospirillaceae bacterium]